MKTIERKKHLVFAKALEIFIKKLSTHPDFNKKNSHERDIYLHLAAAIWILQDKTFLDGIATLQNDIYNPEKLGCGDYHEKELEKRIMGIVGRKAKAIEK